MYPCSCWNTAIKRGGQVEEVVQCPHLHFKTDVIDRNVLSKEQHLNLLSTPKGYRWEEYRKEGGDGGEPVEEISSPRRIMCSGRRMKKAEKVYVHNFLAEVWNLLTPEMVDRLKGMLMNEFGMSPQDADDFICKQREENIVNSSTVSFYKKARDIGDGKYVYDHVVKMRNPNKAHCDKFPKLNLGVRNTWIKDFSDSLSDMMSSYVLDTICAERTDRQQEIAQTLLNRFNGLLEQKASMSDPKTPTDKTLVLVADRLATWLDNNVGVSKEAAQQIKLIGEAEQRKKMEEDRKRRHEEMKKERERREAEEQAQRLADEQAQRLADEQAQKAQKLSKENEDKKMSDEKQAQELANEEKTQKLAEVGEKEKSHGGPEEPTTGNVQDETLGEPAAEKKEDGEAQKAEEQQPKKEEAQEAAKPEVEENKEQDEQKESDEGAAAVAAEQQKALDELKQKEEDEKAAVAAAAAEAEKLKAEDEGRKAEQEAAKAEQKTVEEVQKKAEQEAAEAEKRSEEEKKTAEAEKQKVEEEQLKAEEERMKREKEAAEAAEILRQKAEDEQKKKTEEELEAEPIKGNEKPADQKPVEQLSEQALVPSDVPVEDIPLSETTESEPPVSDVEDEPLPVLPAEKGDEDEHIKRVEEKPADKMRPEVSGREEVGLSREEKEKRTNEVLKSVASIILETKVDSSPRQEALKDIMGKQLEENLGDQDKDAIEKVSSKIGTWIDKMVDQATLEYGERESSRPPPGPEDIWAPASSKAQPQISRPGGMKAPAEPSLLPGASRAPGEPGWVPEVAGVPSQPGWVPGVPGAPSQPGWVPGAAVAPSQPGWVPGVAGAPSQPGWVSGVPGTPSQPGWVPGVAGAPSQPGWVRGVPGTPSQPGWVPGVTGAPSHPGWVPGVAGAPSHPGWVPGATGAPTQPGVPGVSTALGQAGRVPGFGRTAEEPGWLPGVSGVQESGALGIRAPIAQRPKGRIYHLNRTGSGFDVNMISNTRAQEKIRLARGKSPAYDNVPNPDAPMEPADLKRWHKWTSALGEVAESWAEWIKDTIKGAQQRGEEMVRDSSPQRLSEWREFRDNRAQSARKWQQTKKDMEQRAEMWSKKGRRVQSQ